MYVHGEQGTQGFPREMRRLPLQSTSWNPAAHARAVGSCVTPADAADLETFKYCSWVIAQVTQVSHEQDSNRKTDVLLLHRSKIISLVDSFLVK